MENDCEEDQCILDSGNFIRLFHSVKHGKYDQNFLLVILVI